MPRYDLLIVGAGPAGFACARRYQALRPDSSVAVLERLDGRKHALYHRMCGEGISEKGLAECPDAGSDLILNHITKAVEKYPEDVLVQSSIKGLIIDRTALLRKMRERFVSQGGECLQDTFQSMRKDGLWQVQTKVSGTISAKAVIGADGAGSAVRQALFPQLRPEIIWTEQYLLDQPAQEDTIEFQYAERYLGGYRYVFPMGRRMKIGFPLGTDVRPKEFLERHARGISIGDLHGFSLRDAALVGDAAAQVNPITFGGIRTAMAAGRMAAEGAASGDLRSYEKAWERSPLCPARFMPVYKELKGLDDAASAALARPLSGSMASMRCAAAIARHPGRAKVYKAFMQAMRYGW